jgi:hypothetical protein
VRRGFRLRRQQRVTPCIELPAADAVLARRLCRRCVSVAVSTRRIVIDEGARIQISAADGAGV